MRTSQKNCNCLSQYATLVNVRTSQKHCNTKLFAGMRIGYCSQLVTSREAPTQEHALRGQHAVSAQNHLELALKHLWPLLFSCSTSLRQKLGFLVLLAFRELFVYLTFCPIVLAAVYVLRSPDNVAAFCCAIATGGAIVSAGPVRMLGAWQLSLGEARTGLRTFLLCCMMQPFWCCYLTVIQV